MGRPYVGEFRASARAHGWLPGTSPLTPGAEIAAATGLHAAPLQCPCTDERFCEQIDRLDCDEVQGAVIHAVLYHQRGCYGDQSSIH